MVKCNPATLGSGGDMAVHNGAIYSLMGAFGPHKSTDGSTWEAATGDITGCSGWIKHSDTVGYDFFSPLKQRLAISCYTHFISRNLLVLFCAKGEL